MKCASLLFVCALVTACGSEQKPPSTPPAAARPAPAAATTYQRLQGKWQSTTDARSVIELKEHQYIDYYDGKEVGAAAFILDRACPQEAGAGHPGDNEKYLVQPKEDMCWEIVGVDDVGLELSYTARGNTLNYRKVK
ncbi:hypothetical protein ACFST9_05345 [Hymenobacter monticola]|uniref:Lipocalin-like domain-containing protein n=1 Tax=Hymenobacter monticola TaxID=1705399 RepID=A0ABY4BAE5_9BACT|nr:hypothetical protein [Hymenobacter monticola]UOE36045.1 hypothetical protein MTP16_10475 [Hymenobacter monticola]